MEYERAIDQPDIMRDYTIPTYGTWDEFNGLYGNRKGIDWQREVLRIILQLLSNISLRLVVEVRRHNIWLHILVMMIRVYGMVAV